MPPSLVNLTATLDLDAPLDRVWPLISDTDRVNRLIGLPAFERAEPGEDLTQQIEGHYLGIPVAWREYPFEWVFEQWFQVEREFASPLPIGRLITGARLSPLPGGRTRVDVWVRIRPRNVIGWVGARLYIGRKMLADLLRVYRSLGELAAAAAMVAPPPRRQPIVNDDRMARGAARLRQFGMASELIERLVAHLSTADEPDVVRMRPFALADAWGVPRLDVLRLFLYATRAGMLDLEWDVICPNCRGASVRAATLSNLGGEAHCTSCHIRYDVNVDESVELRFGVNPDIRDAVDMPYCIGGPANTRHIMSQLWLPPRGGKELRLRLPEGAYRLRSRQLPAVAAVEASQGEGATRVRFGANTIDVEAPVLRSGDVTLKLENTTDSSLLVVLEQSAWSAQAASAALVTALAEFRQLFSAEVLAPGFGVSIRSLTFLFSDLKDSTMIYDTIGDSPAYARVRDHFDVMNRIIANWRGALVKTIGDAVMAVFPAVEDAIEASQEIQREFTAGEIARGNPALRVKLGLHRGPCIAVNANDLLDYFGSTVNIAARVQSTSVGGDIVATNEVLSDPGVQRVLAREALEAETFERELKGFSKKERDSTVFLPDGRARLYRLYVAPPQEEAHPQPSSATP
jgi:class 3 adenylate cyclase